MIGGETLGALKGVMSDTCWAPCGTSRARRGAARSAEVAVKVRKSVHRRDEVYRIRDG